MRSTVVVTAALLGLVVACGGDDGTNVTGDVVVGPGNAFSPQTLTLSTKRAVTWVLAGGTHNVTFEDGATGSGTLTSSAFSRDFTSAAAGTYRYRCTIHSSSFTSGMIGSVVVP